MTLPLQPAWMMATGYDLKGVLPLVMEMTRQDTAATLQAARASS